MKKTAVILITVAVLLSLPSCGSGTEKNGVPDVIVKTFVSEEYADDLEFDAASSESEVSDVSYNIEHNIDKSTHIDIVSVTIIGQSPYGTEQRTIDLQYQYDKSSDLWSHIHSGDCSYSFKPNPDAFLGRWYYELGSLGFEVDIQSFDGNDVSLGAWKWVNGSCTSSGHYTVEGFSDDYGDVGRATFKLETEIKDLYLSLEGLSCDYFLGPDGGPFTHTEIYN